MKKIGRILMSGLIAFTAICFINIPVMAEGTVNISASSESCNVGDEIVFNISAEGPADASVSPEISVTYDPNRLNFLDSSVAYGGGGGGLVTINEAPADITFTVSSGGQATVEVNAVFDGDGANPSYASASVFVEGEDTAAAMGDAAGDSVSGIEAGTVASADGTMLVSSVFADEFMPVGFYKTTVSYEEQMVEAAQFDMGNIVLLYVTDAYGNDGGFKMYNQETGELSDFLQLMGIENRFIIALMADESVEVPENFTKAVLQWDNQVLEAYSYNGDLNEGGMSANEFFLIYAVSSLGNKGFYMYDQTEGTYQRYVPELHTKAGKSIKENEGGILASITSAGDNKAQNGIDIKLIIIGILALIAIVLLVLFIITMVKLKDYESYDYIDEDEEYNNTVIEKGSQPAFVRNQSTDKLPISEIEEADKTASAPERSEVKKPKEEPKKMKASDLVIRDMDSENNDASEAMAYAEDDIFSPHKRTAKEDKKQAKAEAKAAKKEAKRIKREYGENGYVDWESIGESIKNNEEDMPEAKVNPKYVMDEKEMPAPRQEKVAKPAETKKKPVTDDNGFVYRRGMEMKENPAEILKNIPANDNNRPVQPKPVQQFDFDEDFEFEFISLDDD